MVDNGLALAVAFCRARVRADENAILRLAAGLDPEHDDMLSLILELSRIAATALRNGDQAFGDGHSEQVCDVLAAYERGEVMS